MPFSSNSKSEPVSDQTLWDLRAFPEKITPDEDIVVITREDIVVLFGKGFLLFLVFFVMVIIRTFLAGILGDVAMGIFDTLFYGTNVVLILAFTWIFHNYYLSLGVITSERVIDIDQTGIFRREVNEMSMGTLEDASYKQRGALASMFNFGDVVLQTAGESNVEGQMNGVVFKNVPDPRSVVNTISQMQQNEEQGDREAAAKANAEAMREILAGRKID